MFPNIPDQNLRYMVKTKAIDSRTTLTVPPNGIQLGRGQPAPLLQDGTWSPIEIDSLATWAEISPYAAVERWRPKNWGGNLRRPCRLIAIARHEARHEVGGAPDHWAVSVTFCKGARDDQSSGGKAQE